jgi:hypothetical protein
MKMNILVIGIIFTFLCIQGVFASEEQFSGQGWTCIINKDPIIDPLTGNPYESMGAMIQEENPIFWESLSLEEQMKLNSEPAVTESCSIIGGMCGTEEQRNRAIDLSGQTLTMAEYQALVNPNLWTIVPESQKLFWENQKGIVSSSGVMLIEGANTWAFKTNDNGAIIDGGMTMNELLISDAKCPFNTDDNSIKITSLENGVKNENSLLISKDMLNERIGQIDSKYHISPQYNYQNSNVLVLKKYGMSTS